MVDRADSVARLPGVILLLGDDAHTQLARAGEAEDLATARGHIEEAVKSLRQMIASARAATPPLEDAEDA